MSDPIAMLPLSTLISIATLKQGVAMALLEIDKGNHDHVLVSRALMATKELLTDIEDMVPLVLEDDDGTD